MVFHGGHRAGQNSLYAFDSACGRAGRTDRGLSGPYKIKDMSWQDLARKDGDAMRLAVVGPPEADLSLYPAVCNAAFRAMGIPGEVVPISLEKESFDPCIRHLQEIKFRGAAVAHPYKVDAARIAERFWIARFALGVANTLLFEGGSIFAQNTEVPAIMEALKGIEPGRALIMGTRHAARSVVAALLQPGWHTRGWSRNGDKQQAVMTLLQRHRTNEIAHEPEPGG